MAIIKMCKEIKGAKQGAPFSLRHYFFPRGSPCSAIPAVQYDMASTLTEYLDSQQELEKEAALALPYSFSHCTYSRGHIRQAVYLCITCASRRGICSSCSIACHTDHEQIELFPKRNFRCDCPTSALTQSCSLHKHPEAPNEENEYGQNFEGKFCRCGRPYDAKSERETMIQCLTCEVRSWMFQQR
jgi:E3 ubiquitin-protein ligase UBR7